MQRIAFMLVLVSWIGCDSGRKFECPEFCDLYMECLRPSMMDNHYWDEEQVECENECERIWRDEPGGSDLIGDCEVDECEEFLSCSGSYIDWEAL